MAATAAVREDGAGGVRDSEAMGLVRLDSDSDIGSSVAARRTTVFEHYDADADPDLHEHVVHEKSVARRAWLRASFSALFFLSDLEPATMEEVVDAFEFRDVERGEHVIDQGDEGDYVYLVLAGTLEAYVKKDKVTRLVKTYAGDGFFGELALLYNQKRAATIIAKTDCTIAALDRATFKRIDMRGRKKQRARYLEFLKSVVLFRSLNDLELEDVADNLHAETVEPGGLILKQGAAGGDCMFFVESGEVRCTKNENGVEREVARVSSGGYFGELALLTRQPRACSVFAIGQVRLARLQVDAFERLMGPCMQMMRERTGAYGPRLAGLVRELEERERNGSDSGTNSGTGPIPMADETLE